MPMKSITWEQCVKCEFEQGKTMDSKRLFSIHEKKDGTCYIGLKQGRSGNCPNPLMAFISDVCNLALDKGATLVDIKELAMGITCKHNVLGAKSCLDLMARDIKTFLEDNKNEKKG
jgi:hypothetical protein